MPANLYYWRLSFQEPLEEIEASDCLAEYTGQQLGEDIKFDVESEIQTLLEQGMDIHVVENVSHEFILDWIETTNGQLISHRTILKMKIAASLSSPSKKEKRSMYPALTLGS